MNLRTTNLENWGRKNKIQDETEKMGLVMELGGTFQDPKDMCRVFRTYKKMYMWKNKVQN